MKNDRAGRAGEGKRKSKDKGPFQPAPAVRELLDHIAELLAREYIDLLEEATESHDGSNATEEKD